MEQESMRRLVAAARVGRLGTVGTDGHPHLVPVCFALRGQIVYSAVDHKPKRGPGLRRLANLAATGRASLLVDEYAEDWSTLWWVRLDGRGRVVADPAEAAAALAALAEKYPQYRAQPPGGPVIAVDAARWRGWSAAATSSIMNLSSWSTPPAGPNSMIDGAAAETGQLSPLVSRLELRPHPEGGWFRETWRSPLALHPPGYPGIRNAATAIYFLLHPGERSRWHVVRSAELWLWHGGGPLTLRLGGSGESPVAAGAEEIRLGPDLAGGAHPQAVVPAGVWQAAEPAGPVPVLVSCVVAPGFDPADFRLL